MQTLLYLDSARMGLMCERARLAHVDYIRLAGHEGCSLYFEQLLKEGFAGWPHELRRRYPNLSDWQGIEDLKQSLCRVAQVPSSTQVLLANRTAQLMQLAARMLSERCRRILTTDLCWPSYRRIIERHRRDAGVGITTVPIRQAVFEQDASTSDIVEKIVRQYTNMDCDGLLLPAVSHDGIRLPIDSICHAVSHLRRPSFVVVDGAQALGHVPDKLGVQHCDIFVAGCHKWLQGHVPMGMAFLPNRNSSERLVTTVDRMMVCDELDDPLLAFTRQLENSSLEMFSETVALGCLFSCQAAIAGHQNNGVSVKSQFEQRRRNAAVLTNAAKGLGWLPAVTADDFASGIVLLQVTDPALRRVSSKLAREFFLSHGIAVTCYDDGMIRLSMPDRPWHRSQLDLLLCTLRDYANLNAPQNMTFDSAAQVERATA